MQGSCGCTLPPAAAPADHASHPLTDRAPSFLAFSLLHECSSTPRITSSTPPASGQTAGASATARQVRLLALLLLLAWRGRERRVWQPASPPGALSGLQSSARVLMSRAPPPCAPTHRLLFCRQRLLCGGARGRHQAPSCVVRQHGQLSCRTACKHTVRPQQHDTNAYTSAAAAAARPEPVERWLTAPRSDTTHEPPPVPCILSRAPGAPSLDIHPQQLTLFCPTCT